MEGRTGYARSGDAHLAYAVSGTGPIDLVYTGGYTISYESADEEPHVAHMLRRLSSFSRLIRFDLRGIGASDPIDPAHPPTPAAQAADMLAVLDAVGSERAVLMSDGTGGGAITLAATSPTRVQALVLVNSAARVVADEGYDIGYPPELVETFLADNTNPDTEWTLDDSDDVDLLVATLAHDTRFREWWTRAARRGASPATARVIITANTLADTRELLPLITVPTLVVHSRRNRFVPPPLGRYVADHIPGAQFVAIDTPDNSMLGLDADLYVDVIEEFLTGKRGGAERVLATVLFTDIVDSTTHASALGDRSWSALLDNHDAIVRAELARYGGREVNTTGDGFVSAFDSPTQAVRAGQAIVTGAAAGGLEVRVGIHTGECERRGNDLAGLAVHIAARVAATAEPGEVLVSRTVRDLVAGSELKLADRGEHQLKGVAESWQLYALKP